MRKSHQRQTVKLDALLDALNETLMSLCECDPRHRAFVVVTDTVTGRFVQFSGSSKELLWFDAPQLGVINNGPKFDNALLAAAYACQALRNFHHLPGCAELEITFESTPTSEPS